MLALDIVRHRLYNQRITCSFELPEQAVAWFGAMQAQDYNGVKWAIGLRCYHTSATMVEQAIANRTIVRTWAMRGTLHVVAAADVRWMLALLAPRILANSARRRQQLELDETVFAHSREILARALQGGKLLTRAETLSVLEQAGISTAGQRGYHLLRQAALTGLICFGPMQGKQETFVLLDEWLPPSKTMHRNAALAELAIRYFRSHGPATLQDFAGWSGLLVSDARTGLEAVKNQLHPESMEGQTCWLPQNSSTPKDLSPTAYLLPAFDEYFLGYQVRTRILDAHYDKRVVSSNGIFRPIIVIDGQIVGIWKRALRKGGVIIIPSPFHPLTTAENEALLLAANQYGVFLGLPVEVIHA